MERLLLLIVSAVLLLLSPAGLYGFGGDALRASEKLHLAVGDYLLADSGRAHLLLLLYFSVVGIGLAPLVVWLLLNLRTDATIPSVVSGAGTATAYVLLPFGVYPSMVLLRGIRRLTER